MTLPEIIPIAATPVIILYAAYRFARPKGSAPIAWIVPAFLSVLFALFTVWAIAQEGLTGFWPNHSTSFWGNQVWIDLVLAIATGWLILLPHARKLGMNVWIWFIFTCFTGSIGFLAAVARFLYLREKVPA